MLFVLKLVLKFSLTSCTSSGYSCCNSLVSPIPLSHSSWAQPQWFMKQRCQNDHSIVILCHCPTPLHWIAAFSKTKHTFLCFWCILSIGGPNVPKAIQQTVVHDLLLLWWQKVSKSTNLSPNYERTLCLRSLRNRKNICQLRCREISNDILAKSTTEATATAVCPGSNVLLRLHTFISASYLHSFYVMKAYHSELRKSVRSGFMGRRMRMILSPTGRFTVRCSAVQVSASYCSRLRFVRSRTHNSPSFLLSWLTNTPEKYFWLPQQSKNDTVKTHFAFLSLGQVGVMLFSKTLLAMNVAEFCLSDWEQSDVFENGRDCFNTRSFQRTAMTISVTYCQRSVGFRIDLVQQRSSSNVATICHWLTNPLNLPPLLSIFPAKRTTRFTRSRRFLPSIKRTWGSPRRISEQAVLIGGVTDSKHGPQTFGKTDVTLPHSLVTYVDILFQRSRQQLCAMARTSAAWSITCS